jgi:hypothetical protein
VNLRSQIHSAIDDVAPPAPALPHDAVDFALSNGRLRNRERVRVQTGWGFGMRRAGSLLAGAMVIVMVVTLVAGGRLWRDWNTQQQNAARQAHVAELRARPLYLPLIEPGAPCPQSPLVYDDRGYFEGYGTGPVYAKSALRYGLNSGTYFSTSYRSDQSVSGLVLIRGRDLKTNQPVVFAKWPYQQVSKGTPSGNVIGTELVLGVRVELHPELLLDPSLRLPPPNDAWVGLEGFPNGSSGCIGIQADGFNADGSAFSEIIVVNYLLLS